MKTPTFTLPDQDGKEHSLSEYAGKWVLVYFYPKDDTPGCTIEACAIRDSWSEFQKHEIVVLGISADTTTKHRKFADKYELPFTLLSDPNKKVIKAFGVLREKSMFGKKYMGISRESFLIDPESKIVKHYEKVKPATHAQEVLSHINSLTQ